MKTYNVVLEKGEEEQEVILTSMAFSYALYEDLKALVNEEIEEIEFLSFLDEKSIEIEDTLKEKWEEWKEEREDDTI